jgi:hypothetical protein
MYGRRCRWAILAEENDTGRTEHWCLARLRSWICTILADESGTFRTGGLRPPLLALLQRPYAGRIMDFCDAQTHIHKSGGRQPAVVGETNAVP